MSILTSESSLKLSDAGVCPGKEAWQIDRLGPCRRPDERIAGYHVWSDLLFAHWRVPVELLRPLIPRELEIDTFGGEAWLGLVPFHMSGVRPRWCL